MTKVKKKDALLTVKKGMIAKSRITIVGLILMIGAALMIVLQVVIVILLITNGIEFDEPEDEQITTEDEEEVQPGDICLMISFGPGILAVICIGIGFKVLTVGMRTMRIYQQGVGYSGNFLSGSDKIRPWSVVGKVTVKREKDQSVFDKELYRVEVKASGETISEVMDPEQMKKVVKQISAINMTKLDESALKHVGLYGRY
jgi:hypothetical protein